MNFSLQDSYEECRQLNKYYGTPFYSALTSFPKRIQTHINAVCAYARIIDQIIDHPKPGVSKQQQVQAINNLLDTFDQGLSDSYSKHQYLQAIVHTSKFCEIPAAYFHNFAKEMINSLNQDRCESFSSLKKHIDNTAGISAAMVAHILRSSDKKSILQLQHLARAGQLIKVICNTSKDFDLRNKIYLSSKDFKKFGYKIKELKEKKINDNWRNLLEHYLQTAEKEVGYLQKSLGNFPEHSHRALNETSQIYLSLIEQIRKMDYNIFSRRPDVTWAHRLRCALPF